MQNELIVLSHLRWDWVWQRPQHLVSRLGSHCTTWYVEEPLTPAADYRGTNRLNHARVDGVNRAWLEIPEQGHHVGFFDDVLPDYIEQLPQLVGEPAGERVVWLYTPLALELALALNPTTLVYDVMDDLAAFKDAPPELVVRQRQALRRADVVFAGGRSLHRSIVRQGRADALLFPSGVEPEHFQRPSPPVRSERHRPVAGYMGVLDERLDLELLAGLASALPEWDIRMYGPMAKIDPATLPQSPNIHYAGYTSYSDLPAALAGLDVALMPFAMNEATRSISPTKTLEYIAAGLPVISTRVPDVVADFPGVVHLRDDAAGFAALCRQLGRRDPARAPRAGTRELLAKYHWDTIAQQMAESVFKNATRQPDPTEATA
ncbi:glycosyltransferase [Arthrobacter sp. ISL-85]|uniref:glycosyltransferase n=1 Tax=Arthrobacter sp. ISL-85 TaxID=2819115 RepID=UPI001BEAA66C|nr:glycosyltransferase [Arthrobacter sp. ISL-85]MBT2566298.1 glycosyltransferase [Arthrobacter sp. ISL-85]